MKYFQIAPNDARWLIRWLHGNLVGVAMILGLLTAYKVLSPDTTKCRSDAYAQIAKSSATSIVPEGWRRTAHGWEHTSNWRISKPLGHWIELQEHREPAWIQSALKVLREIPPVLYAFLQLTVITIIAQVSFRSSHRDMDLQPTDC